jgi:hypothetical protein
MNKMTWKKDTIAIKRWSRGLSTITISSGISQFVVQFTVFLFLTEEFRSKKFKMICQIKIEMCPHPKRTSVEDGCPPSWSVYGNGMPEPGGGPGRVSWPLRPLEVTGRGEHIVSEICLKHLHHIYTCFLPSLGFGNGWISTFRPRNKFGKREGQPAAASERLPCHWGMTHFNTGALGSEGFKMFSLPSQAKQCNLGSTWFLELKHVWLIHKIAPH